MRREVAEAVEPAPLTHRQSEVYQAIVAYCEFMRTDACPASYIAERLGIDYSTVRRDYFGALHRKGWLETDASPARPSPFRR